MNYDRYARADRDEGHYVNLAGEQYIGFVSKQLACMLLDEMAENDATDALVWFAAVIGEESLKHAPDYVIEAVERADRDYQARLRKDFLERQQAGETNDDDEEIYPEDFGPSHDESNF